MKRNFVRSVLLLVFGLAMVALPAMAQETFSVATTPINVRGEGLKEAIGPVIFGATTGTSTTPAVIKAGSAMFITFPTGVTVTGPGALSCIPSTVCTGVTATVPVTSPNVLQISFASDDSIISGDTITASGLRVNASALAATSVATLSASLSAIVPPAFLATNPIGFLQPAVPVAYVQPKATTVTLSTGPGSALTCSPVAAEFGVTITENFPTAFTSQSDELGLTPAPAPAPTNSLQLLVTVANVPSGATITGLAPTYPTAQGTSLTVVEATGSSCTSGVNSTGAAITCLYDIAADSPTAIESVILNYSIAFSGSLPSSPPPPAITVAVSLAPTTPSSAIPLFVATNNEGSFTAVAVTPCVTYLLFPWITNFNVTSSHAANSHYDTGIVIANTTTDPWSSALPQNGNCTLTMYPQFNPASASGPTPITFVTLPALSGNTLSFTASMAFPGASGYVIGLCNFQNAHSYIYIVDNAGLGQPHTAANYVGLVLPNPTALPRNPAGKGLGESLGQ